MSPTPGSNELNQLFHAYSPNELTYIEHNEAAYANEVFNLMDSDGQRYVMRILKTQDPATVNMEAQLQARLNFAGITTPQYLEFGYNNFLGERNGYRFTLS